MHSRSVTLLASQKHLPNRGPAGVNTPDAIKPSANATARGQASAASSRGGSATRGFTAIQRRGGDVCQMRHAVVRAKRPHNREPAIGKRKPAFNRAHNPTRTHDITEPSPQSKTVLQVTVARSNFERTCGQREEARRGCDATTEHQCSIMPRATFRVQSQRGERRR